MSFSVRVLLLLLVSSLLCAQPPTSDGGANSDGAAKPGIAAPAEVAPVITFTLDFPQSQPEHYSIRVPSEGAAHYQSIGRIPGDSGDSDSFDFDFVLSAEMRGKMFRLAAGAGHFQNDLDSHQKNLAFTGRKTLSYADAQHAGEATFIYSANPAAHQLADLFQTLSATLEFGHRLDWDRRYQKLALDDELKRMQEMAQDKELVEVAAIQPILEQIVADRSVMNVARARAQQLLGAPVGR
jgi:hypothetical protein